MSFNCCHGASVGPARAASYAPSTIWDVLNTIPCSRGTLDALRRFVAAPLPSVVALTGPSELTLLAAEALGRSVLPASAHALDLHVVRHDKDRWSTDELQEKIVHPSSLVPMHRTIVAVQDAHRMEASLADQLLKMLEEQTHPTTFILCVPDVSSLPITLQSRIARVLQIEPAMQQDLARRLEAAGLVRADAVEASGYVHDVPDLLPLLEAQPSLLEPVRAVFAASLFCPQPAMAAASIAENIEVVAKALLALNDAKSNDTAVRAKARTLCAVLASRWRADISAAVHDVDSASFNALHRAAVGLDELEAALWRYRPLAASLTAALMTARTTPAAS